MFTTPSCPLRPPRSWLHLVWLVLLTTLVVTGCGKPATRPTPPPAVEQPAQAGESEVTVELDETEREALRAQAEADLLESEAILRSLDRDRLSAEQLEKVRSVEGLILAARAAGEKTDVTAMANLARKARLLANELIPG